MTPADIERGGQIFLASCSVCHGPDGDAIAGSDVGTGTFRRGSSDQELIDVILKGIPGTAMPPNNLPQADAARVVGFLRSLPSNRTTPKTAGLRGDPANGKSLFEGKGICRECHLANGAGAFLGPDLSSVGVTRRMIELERALTEPSADMRTGSRTALVVRRDGATVVGRLLNQDTYSLQLIDAKGTLLSFDKESVRRWEIQEGSAMPSYAEKFTPQEIADVVSYLRTMKAPPPANPGGRFGGPSRGAPPAAPGVSPAGGAGRSGRVGGQ
jgi:putative heme-binding domain-containing protein